MHASTPLRDSSGFAPDSPAATASMSIHLVLTRHATPRCCVGAVSERQLMGDQGEIVPVWHGMPVPLGCAYETQTFVDTLGREHHASGRQDDGRAALRGPGVVEAGAVGSPAPRPRAARWTASMRISALPRPASRTWGRGRGRRRRRRGYGPSPRTPYLGGGRTPGHLAQFARMHLALTEVEETAGGVGAGGHVAVGPVRAARDPPNHRGHGPELPDARVAGCARSDSMEVAVGAVRILCPASPPSREPLSELARRTP